MLVNCSFRKEVIVVSRRSIGSRIGPLDSKQTWRNRGNQDTMVGNIPLREARKERRLASSVNHQEGKQFRDGHKVLREKNGTFATETAPSHKRPRRIPWKKEGRNWKRREAKKRSRK
jgi:hypothetical protein